MALGCLYVRHLSALLHVFGTQMENPLSLPPHLIAMTFLSPYLLGIPMMENVLFIAAIFGFFIIDERHHTYLRTVWTPSH